MSIGHNSLAPFDRDRANQLFNDLEFDAAAAKKRGLADFGGDGGPARLKDMIEAARLAWSFMDKRRKGEKEPFAIEAKAVDAAFCPYLTELDGAWKHLKSIAAEHLAQMEVEHRRQRDAEMKAAQEAARQAAIAEAETRADDTTTPAERVEAHRAAKAAEKDAAQAAKAAPERARIEGGAGRALTARTRRVCEIEDLEKAFFEFCDHDEIRELLVRLSNRRANAAGFAGEIAGFKIIERKIV